MGDLLASILLPTVGIIMSPTPVVAILFIAMNSKNARNSLAFLAGWIASFAFVMLAVLLVANTRYFFDSYQDITPIVYGVTLATGIFLILLAAYSWLRRPRKNAPVKPPKWLRSVSNITPLKSFGVACVLAGFSPKNSILAATSAVAISGLSVNMGEAIVFTLLFLIVASLVVAVLVGYFTLAPKGIKSASHKIERIIYHSSTSMAIALALVGVVMVAYSAVHLLGL